MDISDLNFFLKCGFFLNFENKQTWIPEFEVNESYNSLDEEELVELGCKLLRESIDECFEPGRKNLVPISGGLDSRVILGVLRESTEVKNLNTFTFGVPGTYDYDIGNLIASRLQTKHQNLNLNQKRYKIYDLIKTAKRFQCQTMLFHHPPIGDLLSEYNEMQYWSGFMGDPIAGSHLRKNPSQNINEGKVSFNKYNQYATSLDLCSSESGDNNYEIDFNEKFSFLTIDENLDFFNRQNKYIAPHVLFEGFDYKLPFIQKKWVEFMLSVDNKHRFDISLYKKILMNLNSNLFNLPYKDNFGLSLDPSRFSLWKKRLINKFRFKINKIYPIFQNPWTNYIDYDRAIRQREDLKNIMWDSLVDLKNRNLIDWIDIIQIFKDHISKKANHSDVLIILASLEINLKAGRII